MRQAYIVKTFSPAHRAVIAQADSICREYAAQGYDLTLRQLYYQFVARGLIANRQTEYKRLGTIVNDARMAGELDWSYIVDRTRAVVIPQAWDDPADIIEASARGYAIDRWAGQPVRVEAWIEKEALAGVLERPAKLENVPYFACRGYNSQSNARSAAKRLERHLDAGAERVVILHLGDHDPSGIDMTRDIRERFETFLIGDGYDPEQVTIRRLALNMDQVEEHQPPPNPAKLTDSRAGGYVARYGYDSWELDALDPVTIAGLITEAVDEVRDPDLWRQACEREEDDRRILRAAVERWEDVEELLGT